MESKYPVFWERASGERVAIERMNHEELEAALHLLEREDCSDPVADSLHDAVAQELMRRRFQPFTPPPRSRSAVFEATQRRAA